MTRAGAGPGRAGSGRTGAGHAGGVHAGGGRALAGASVVLFLLVAGAIVLSAGETLGYDFAAYRDAAIRVLEGGALYDRAATVAGPAGLFLYPPPFALLVLPFAALPAALAIGLWVALLIAALLVAIALLPVAPPIRTLVLLLAALDWPVHYAIKLGQVGPLLVLVFVLAWRSLARPTALGGAIALGTMVKLQPGLLLAWAILRRERRAVGVAVAILAGAALAATLVVGPDAWLDLASLLSRVTRPVTTPHVVTPGAIAYALGASEELAGLVQGGVVVGALGATAWTALRGDAERGFVVAIVASQLVSPVLWDHYAIVLLVPVAYLLDRRVRLAALIPLATALPLVGLTPPAAYPLLFGTTLLALLRVGSTLGSNGRSAAGPVLSSAA